MTNALQYFQGYRLIETTAITKTVQARTHKNKRINKKWRKRYGYREAPDYEKVVVTGDCIFAQPKTLAKIIEVIKTQEDNNGEN